MKKISRALVFFLSVALIAACAIFVISADSEGTVSTPSVNEALVFAGGSEKEKDPEWGLDGVAYLKDSDVDVTDGINAMWTSFDVLYDKDVSFNFSFRLRRDETNAVVPFFQFMNSDIRSPTKSDPSGSAQPKYYFTEDDYGWHHIDMCLTEEHEVDPVTKAVSYTFTVRFFVDGVEGQSYKSVIRDTTLYPYIVTVDENGNETVTEQDVCMYLYGGSNGLIRRYTTTKLWVRNFNWIKQYTGGIGRIDPVGKYVPLSYTLEGGEMPYTLYDAGAYDRTQYAYVPPEDYNPWDFVYKIQKDVYAYAILGGETVLPVPTRPGYTFAGWTVEGNPTTATVEGNTLRVSAAHTGEIKLVARWIDAGGAVIYEANGAILGGEYDITFSKAAPSLLKLPSEVTLDGYTFIGWYTTPSFTGAPIAHYNVTEAMLGGPDEIRFYARFVKHFQKLTFNDDVQVDVANSGHEFGPAFQTYARSVYIPEVDETHMAITAHNTADGLLYVSKLFGSDSDFHEGRFLAALPGGVSSGSFAVDIDVKKDHYEPLLQTELRAFFSDTCQPAILSITPDGALRAGGPDGQRFAEVTDKIVTVTAVCSFTRTDAGEALLVNFYMDNALVCGDYLIEGLEAPASSLEQLDIYFDRNATGAVYFDNIAVYDGLHSVNLPSLGSKITYHGLILDLPASAPRANAHGVLTVLPTATEMAVHGYTFHGWYTNPDFTGEPVTQFAPNDKGIYDVYAKYEGHYDVTFIVNGVDTGEGLEKVGIVTLPTSYDYWIDPNGRLYAGGTRVELPGSVTYTALTVDMAPGASVRFDAPIGLRFEATVNDAMLSLLEKNEDIAIRLGTLIVPTDKLGTLKFTAEALARAGIGCVEMAADLSDVSQKNGVYHFSTSLTNILLDNYTRKFSAVSYIEVTVGEDTYRSYGAYSEEENARSIYEVAHAALTGNESYTDEQKIILRSFVDMVVSLDPITLAVNNEAEGKYESPYAAVYDRGSGTLVISRRDGKAITDESVSTVLIGSVGYTRGWRITSGRLMATYRTSPFLTYGMPYLQENFEKKRNK